MTSVCPYFFITPRFLMLFSLFFPRRTTAKTKKNNSSAKPEKNKNKTVMLPSSSVNLENNLITPCPAKFIHRASLKTKREASGEIFFCSSKRNFARIMVISAKKFRKKGRKNSRRFVRGEFLEMPSSFVIFVYHSNVGTLKKENIIKEISISKKIQPILLPKNPNKSLELKKIRCNHIFFSKTKLVSNCTNSTMMDNLFLRLFL